MEIKFYKTLPGMATENCVICGKPNCEVLVQEYTFGGNYCVIHETCLEQFMKEDDEEPQSEERQNRE